MRKKARGSGSIYLCGKIWWIQYWDHGRPRNESSKGLDATVAEALLQLGRFGSIPQSFGRSLNLGVGGTEDLRTVGQEH